MTRAGCHPGLDPLLSGDSFSFGFQVFDLSCEFKRITTNLYRCGFANAGHSQACRGRRHRPRSGKSSRRGRRYPAGAHTVAVYASLRLRCDARPGVGVAELAARPEGRFAQTAATSQLTKRARRARPQTEHRSRHRNEPPPGTACREPTWWARKVEHQPCLQQSRVRAGRGASLRGAWVCLISWPRAALRQLTRRTCLSGARPKRAKRVVRRGHEIKQTQGSRCEGTDRLADATRPARTRLCRVSLHYRITHAVLNLRTVVRLTLDPCLAGQGVGQRAMDCGSSPQ